MNHHEQEQLEQQLLELHYGLLDDTEAQALRQRIESEADVASLWAKTLGLAGQLADAANLAGVSSVEGIETSGFNLRLSTDVVQPDVVQPNRMGDLVDGAVGQASQNMNGTVFFPAGQSQENKSKSWGDQKPLSRELALQRFRRLQRWHRGFIELVSVLAGLLLAVIVLGLVVNMPESPATAVLIEAESVIGDEGATNRFELFTSSMAAHAGNATELARGVSATLTVAIKVNNVVVHRDQIETNSSGKCTFVVPPELRLPKAAKLHLNRAGETDSKLEVVLPLAPTRCLTYLNLDKPVYRPGEVVRFRSLTLERFSLKSDIDLPVRFELIDPSGAAVNGARLDGVTDRGVGNGAFQIPSGAPGGQYTLVAKSLDGFFPEERRTFQVRNYRVPRIKKDLEFRRRSYGQGDLVEADFEAIRAEGGPLSSTRVNFTAKVDGTPEVRGWAMTDSEGRCLISFKLADHLTQGDGQLSVVVDDGGTQEVISKTIPIQLGKVEVDFFPEGGYLVEGMLNRVYFSARNTLGKPIQLAGEIIDRSGKQVAKIETVRDGMGRFEFAPVAGQRYSLKVSDPIDVTNSPKLPSVVKGLPVISTGDGVFANDENIQFEIKSAKTQKMIVQLACRGTLVANQQLDLKPGTSSLDIELPNEVEGVLRLTILSAESVPARPLVERLVYRESRRKLSVKIDEESIQRTPGEPVRLTLSVFDENGEPAPAVLGVAVVDDAALSLEQDELPELQTHFMLTSEIEKPEDLEHANFYLSGSDQSRESLDLLLGTQGWRRFVTSQNFAGIDASGFGEQVARLIELDGATPASVSVANVSSINRQWQIYSAAVSKNWRNFWTGVRWLVLPFLILMLVIYLFRPRFRFVAANACLLLASSLALTVGCGVNNEQASARGPAVAGEAGAAISGMDDSVNGMDDDSKSLPPPPPMKVPPGNALPSFVFSNPNPESKNGSNQVRIVQHRDPEFTDQTIFAEEAGDFDSSGGLLSEGQLLKLLEARGLTADSLGGQLLDELRFPVREYAHQHVSTRSDVREDFAETVYWQPLLITDSTGKATISFELSDSVTTFKVLADAHSSVGRIGSGGGEVVSRLPLQVEPKMPIAVTDGDRIDLPVAVINSTQGELDVDLEIEPSGSFKLVGPKTLAWKLGQQERTRGNFSLDVIGANEATATIELTGSSGKGLKDRIVRNVIVSPSGYPVRQSVSGVLENNATVKLPIPADAISGSLAVSVKAFPSPLADMLAGVESILREPHGCFEQTSATNYPNAMALIYLQENRLSNPKTTRKAKSLLDRGYQKLVSFECEKLGYEWFGSDPGHEALSAFGLMQFTDMSKVMSVNVEMMARTRSWLMSRRDGNGSFQRNPRHLHAWSVQQQIVDAYVLWALTEADVASGNAQRSAFDLAKELEKLNEVARNSSDPYLVSLAASSMANVGRKSDAEFLMDKLVELQKQSGELIGQSTVVQSGGISRSVETTAIAILAWSKDPKYSQAQTKAVQWLVKNRNGNGGFGSTQATVLALKALVAYSKVASQESSGGVLLIKRKGEVIGQATLPTEVTNSSMVEITGLGSEFDPGEKNSDLDLVAEGTNGLPYSIEILYHTSTPPSDDRCPLELTTQFESTSDKDGQVESGETLMVKVVLKNKTEQGKPMTVATIGLPGGVEPRVEQLDEMREAGVFDFYEVRPREVTCYWRTIAPGETKEVSFDVTAEISGKYTGPASRAYLYYTAEQKVWTEPLAIEIGK